MQQAEAVQWCTAQLRADVMSVLTRIVRSFDQELGAAELRHPSCQSDEPFGGWSHESEMMLGALDSAGEYVACVEAMFEPWREKMVGALKRQLDTDAVLRLSMLEVLHQGEQLFLALIQDYGKYTCESYTVQAEDIWDIASAVWRQLKIKLAEVNEVDETKQN